MKQQLTHKNLGVVYATEDTFRMQLENPDPSSYFVEHDDEIKEVSRNMIVEFCGDRADSEISIKEPTI